MQVASAFLTDLLEIDPRPAWLADAEIRLSGRLVQHLAFPAEHLPGHVTIGNSSRAPWFVLPAPRTTEADLRFRLFGPAYDRRQAKVELVGFALPKMIFRYDGASRGRVDRLRSGLMHMVKRGAFLRADRFVVETEAVATALGQRLKISPDLIAVVHNEPHAIFRDGSFRPNRWTGAGTIRLLFPARGYSHKNHGILAAVHQACRDHHAIDVEIGVTLRDEEWDALSPQKQRGLVNHGEVTPSGLKELYASAHAVIFPSLIECASATPLEARVLGLPLLASDRDLVSGSAGSANVLFDPLDPMSAAEAVRILVADRQRLYDDAARDAEAYRVALKERSRTLAYVEIIDGLLDSEPWAGSVTSQPIHG